ncbi:MAG: VTC domain-containing protein [candidate division Zixibacteria bacterium]|nr:VTC domain-containing protein [candidate division Zixibacteria bacterium]NIW40135.1 VTC domain-containing protein [candidate division Zixibacteria bacterium]NIX59096.1 VTC domain-containing protein [candidate division Zixibacteria bacterium]
MSYKIPDVTRYEIKYVARETYLHSVVHWIRMHREGFIRAYPNRWVNNIYFDSPDYVAFMDNLSGASSRSKVRYRWYGESRTPDSGILEIKRKRNLFVWKLLYKVEEAPYFPGASWREICQRLRSQIPEEGMHWMQDYPHPMIINQYLRQYFVTPDHKIRVTVDSKQKIWDQRFKTAPNFDHRANFPETLIVEVKFDRQDRDRASSIVKDIPIRYSRNSKYMTGVGAVHTL